VAETWTPRVVGSGGGDDELVAQHQDLQVPGGITAGVQGEQLDGAAQRQVGEFRQSIRMTSTEGAGASQYRATLRANPQLSDPDRLSAPYGR
jgi:hypothetical protein